MKKTLTTLLTALGMICLIGTDVKADTLTGGSDWKVEFTNDKKMESNFQTSKMDDVLDEMQPGDSAQFQVTLTNSYATNTDWYMTNEVLKSLEDSSKTAKGGAYSYVLTYTNPAGTVTTLYNSETVGGESYADKMQGLHKATNALSDFFYLDTVASGQKGYVNLYVLLDGETQGNDYQDTLAQLQMNFAVEIPTSGEISIPMERKIPSYRENKKVVYEKGEVTVVRTGDLFQMVPWLIAAGILGVLLLVLGIAGIRIRKQMKGATK